MRRIRFEHVTKRFDGVPRPAVDDCSFSVDAGEFVVLLGPSGSGKTTLLKMVNRLYEPTAGQIFIDDDEIHDLPADELRRRIGYVIQQTGLFPHMTVAQNISVVPRLVGWKKPRIGARVDELLDLVGLRPVEEYRARYPGQLSGGEQQRVGVARALAADPGVLLMDEPFGAIDAITRATLQTEMQRLHERVKATILFVTHDVDEALKLADRIAVMHDGRLAQYARPLDLLLRPADEFVAELSGARDTMRKLRLITVADALRMCHGMRLAPVPAGSRPPGDDRQASASHAVRLRARSEEDGEAAGSASRDSLAGARASSGELLAVRPTDSLGDALTALVDGAADEVQVVDAGRRIGTLTLATIQEVLRRREEPSAAAGA